jgi:hypothetical protein
MVKLAIDVFDTNNLKTFGIDDNSIYDNSKTLFNSNIQILIPGFISPVNQIFSKNKRNIFNSNNLGLTNVNSCKEEFTILPDGLYSINYSIEDSNTLEEYCTKVYYYRTAFLSSLYDEAFSLIINECPPDKDKLNQLKEIEFYITGITTNANLSNFEQADKLYLQSELLLSRYLKRC